MFGQMDRHAFSKTFIYFSVFSMLLLATGKKLKAFFIDMKAAILCFCVKEQVRLNTVRLTSK